MMRVQRKLRPCQLTPIVIAASAVQVVPRRVRELVAVARLAAIISVVAEPKHMLENILSSVQDILQPVPILVLCLAGIRGPGGRDAAAVRGGRQRSTV